MIEHLCKACGRSFHRFNSLQTKCPLCTHNKLSTNKPLKKMGKVGKKWVETRHEWLKKNANNSNTWTCVVGGGLLVIDTVTLDHDLSRSRRPDLRFDHDNLKPMCLFHNTDKGSRSLEEYLASQPDMKCKI